MRSTLLRTTSVAMLGFGLAAAPLAFAQDQTQPMTPPAATDPAMPSDPAAPNTTVPEQMAPDAMPSTTDTTTTDTTGAAPSTTAPSTTETTDAAEMDGDRVAVVGSAQPEGTVLATDLQGEPVENSAGEDLATLDDFVVDEQGRIVGAVISFGGFLGMGEKQALLPWEELTIDGSDATVTLAMTFEQIEALPQFEPIERTAANDPMANTAPAPATPAPSAPVTQ